MIGTIDKARKSKSGKTLGLQINGVWYMTKEWELQGMVGKSIEFEPAIDMYMGKEQRWVNEYQMAGGQPPVPGASAPAASHPHPVDLAVNALLLSFVGQVLSGNQGDMENRAKQAYKVGKDILNGRYDAVTTAAPPEYPEKNQDAPPDDYSDDDIPY